MTTRYRIALLLQSRLFQDTVQGAWRDVYTERARHCDCAGFDRMMKLTMVAPRPHEIPSIRFDHFDQLSHFHMVRQHAPQLRTADANASSSRGISGPAGW